MMKQMPDKPEFKPGKRGKDRSCHAEANWSSNHPPRAPRPKFRRTASVPTAARRPAERTRPPEAAVPEAGRSGPRTRQKRRGSSEEKVGGRLVQEDHHAVVSSSLGE